MTTKKTDKLDQLFNQNINYNARSNESLASLFIELKQIVDRANSIINKLKSTLRSNVGETVESTTIKTSKGNVEIGALIAMSHRSITFKRIQQLYNENKISNEVYTILTNESLPTKKYKDRALKIVA